MHEIQSRLRSSVLVGGWFILLVYRALLIQFPNERDALDVVLILVEAIVFGMTVLVSVWPPRRLWHGVVFIALIALASLVTHVLVAMWVLYAIEAGTDSWPAVGVLIAFAASIPPIAAGALLERALLTRLFVVKATLAAIASVLPFAILGSVRLQFPGDQYAGDVTKLLWFASFFAVLWTSRRQIPCDQYNPKLVA